MRRRITYLAEAEEEFKSAIHYYSKRDPLTGKRFKEAVMAVFERIAEDPECYPIRDGLRRCVMTKFPYNIHYHILDTGPQVVAVAHQKRNPGYWLSRLDDN
jgi:plasmid stabilization system protein ParE